MEIKPSFGLKTLLMNNEGDASQRTALTIQYEALPPASCRKQR